MKRYQEEFGQGELNDAVNVSTLVDAIGVDEREIEWRKQFIDFEAKDVQRLEQLREPFEEHTDELAEQFYEHLLTFDETTAIVDRSPKDIEQLERTQMAYLTSLAAGEYDTDYFENRARIGKLHDLLDMPIKHYLGQHNIYYDVCLSIVTDRIHDRIDRSFEESESGEEDLAEELYADIEAGIDELHSLLKILNLDMQVVVETYLQSYVESLELERDRFTALFESVPMPVAVVRIEEENETVEQVNPAFEELFGVAAEEFGTEPFEEVLLPPGEEPRPIEELTVIDDLQSTTDSELSEAKVTLRTVLGQREFIRVSATVERSEIGTLEYAFYLDVTEQQQRQERLQVLSRIMRHNVRNSMNVVTGAASTLQRADTEIQTQLVERIQAASQDLLSISGKLQEVEQLITSTSSRRPVNVEQLVEETLDEFRDQYPESTFVLSVNNSPWVNGTNALRLAIENVIENGVEHNDLPNPTVEVSIVQNLDGDHIDIRIADDGPGIPAREYELLTGQRERTQVDHATGIGLWTVKWFVTNLGGNIQFDANTPRGTIVTLRLPTAEPPD